MNLQTGQRVLCVNDTYNSYCRYPLKKGLVYTVHSFYRCSCGSLQVTLSEIRGSANMGCKCHRTSVRRHSYYVWRFIPMEYFEGYIDLTHDIKKKSRKNEEKESVAGKSYQVILNAVEPDNYISLRSMQIN